MITRSATEFLSALRQLPAVTGARAVPRGVFMVEPTDFRVSHETAADNLYMDLAHEADSGKAVRQFRGLVQKIRDVGVEVKVFPGNLATPDDVFPNNVFATIPGTLIIGRMLYPGRQAEAEREDIPEWFEHRGYQPLDLRERPGVGELTGVLVIDRARKLAFCGMTERVDEQGLQAMHQAFGLDLTFAFELLPGEYHTNVLMSVLAGRACVIHAESIRDSEVVDAIEEVYPGRVLRLTQAEKAAFAGNCIALTAGDLFMSSVAFETLRPASRQLLESWGFTIHHVDLSEIEKAGGSLRCMVGEIF
jgi:hypothetical protein